DLFQARGLFVFKLGGLHAWTSDTGVACCCAAARIALSRRCGVTGVWDTCAPVDLNALLMADMMAAGGAMAPPSPMPLAPNSVLGEGLSICSIWILGTSQAPGMT